MMQKEKMKKPTQDVQGLLQKQDLTGLELDMQIKY